MAIFRQARLDEGVYFRPTSRDDYDPEALDVTLKN
jgi:hypothetical protein